MEVIEVAVTSNLDDFWVTLQKSYNPREELMELLKSETLSAQKLTTFLFSNNDFADGDEVDWRQLSEIVGRFEQDSYNILAFCKDW